MGPSIILDKSTLQSLSPGELFILNKFYFIHITPVILMEILGDLKKPTKDGLSEDRVAILANKLLPSDSVIGAHYMQLLLGSLLGCPVEMGGRPHLAGGVPVRTESGEKGIIHEVSQEEKALNNWKSINFTEAERLLSKQWRESTGNLDLENFKKTAKQQMKILKSPDNIGQLYEYVSDLLVQNNLQTGLLQWLIEEFRVNLQMAQAIFLRWERSQHKLIEDFAPYAFYCFKVLTFFYYGLICDLIGTRATNKVDLEYIYYLPFCMIFTSNDKFHKSIAATFLNSDQAFVSGEDLKEDLRNLSTEWDELEEPRKAAWEAKYGHGPPARKNCLTFQLWRRFWPRWEPGKKGKVSKRSPEEQARLLEKVKRFAESPLDQNARQFPLDDSKVDFMVMEREVSIYDPCPCGSGIKFKDCHWPEVRESQDRSHKDKKN